MRPPNSASTFDNTGRIQEVKDASDWRQKNKGEVVNWTLAKRNPNR